MSLNTSMTAGRHFTVLLHVGGVRKILRDVALSDTHDVLEVVALHAQLRTEHLLLGRGSVVEYFDERHQTFLEVTELSWPRMSSKRHIELRCDQRGGASSSSAQRLTAAQLSQQRDEDDNRRRIGVSVSNLSTGSITQAASGETAPLVQPSAHGLITAEHPSASAPRHHHQPGNNSASASTAAPFSAGSTAGGGAPASPPHAVTMTLKAHIVDAVRKCLAREYPSVLKLSTATSTNGSHATSMPTLVRICAAVLREYQSAKGLRDVTMNEHVGLNTTTTDVKRFIDDIAREVSPMVKQEVLAALREGLLPQTLADLQQPQHPHLPHHPQHAAAMPLQAASANVLPIEKPQVLQASASNSIKDDTSRQISRSAVHTYSTSERHLGAATYSTANVVPPPLLTKIAASSPSASASGKPTIVTPHGNVAAAATPILPPRQLQDDANGYYHQPTVSPSARGSVSHAGTASPATSTFQKVQYSVCGPFPPPFGTLQDQRSPTIRVSLSSPSTAILPDEDILITAHVIARTVSSLTWWLGYGPQRITLNMDELYRRGAVTTFQVSETGLLLTIRRGTLVPGWQYHVHLSASSEITGVTAADHTSFMLSKSATQAMAAAENRMGHQQQQSSRGGGATSVRQHHLRGYDGDEEKSSHVHSGGGVAASPAAPWNPHSPTAASPPAFPSTPSQAHDVGSVRKQQHAPVDPQNPAGMTYQEQLKRFFVDEVQPLYRLCSRPNIRQVDFNDMLQEIARAYWYSRVPEESLDVTQQREIVERVKNAVVAHRSLHRAVNDYRWGGGVVGAGGESSRGSVMHNANTSPLRGGGGGARGGGSSSQGHASFGHTQQVATHASHSFGHKSATDILPAGLRPQYQSLIR